MGAGELTLMRPSLVTGLPRAQKGRKGPGRLAPDGLLGGGRYDGAANTNGPVGRGGEGHQWGELSPRAPAAQHTVAFDGRRPYG
jgi:hypothetical protein